MLKEKFVNSLKVLMKVFALDTLLSFSLQKWLSVVALLYFKNFILFFM